MANPTRGSLKKLKKMSRYLLNRENVVWEFKGREEPKYSYVAAESDWGGACKDRKSNSGGE